jgi:anaerobic ribonucleoside-triphosphate reductase activating protein
MELQVAGIYPNSNSNGDGLRYVIFVSGCRMNCPGCHNKDMQNYSYGKAMTIDEIFEDIKKNASILDGVTFSGGEPFDQAEPLTELAKKIKSLNLSLWSYTGYSYGYLSEYSNRKRPLSKHSIEPKYIKSLLTQLDVLVDGPFVIEQTEGALKYTGSNNQRVIKLI